VNALHEYIRIAGGVGADHMWRDLERSRRLGIPWQGVPTTREDFDAGLAELLAAGMAERMSNGAWLWLPKQRQPVGETKEALLF
jgi:hypothetical protein